ncbi:cationic amino acid transporter 2 isoform X2 [Condylostylus longicornis]|uniref:cationic amino acid transporter 2 isoform X2 n=1 Tax=Condylostylus longicornis TaxID=2530218 RepID=UPI00244E0EC9|nr:cationic amino acid transporter 2 isoform X2 [Condylostylus longicornis]
MRAVTVIHQSCSSFLKAISRKKPISDSTESRLAKVLTAFDLTALGIGSTLGVGVYVLAGQVSKQHAGPAVILSFLIAAIASIFAGLCYAEFGARVPKAGSAYIYSYVTIGEFIAFLIGWNLILEYAIGSASVVKGLSTYLDKLFDNVMQNFFKEHMPMDVPWLSEYPDFFALGVTILFSCAIAFGAKESTFVNNIFTVLNLGVVLFVIIAGLFKVDASNWSIPKEQVPDGYGEGGFMPYGISGVIKGAAVCFYGFIGFDCIATAGEEAKNPRKSIPFAVIVSLAMIFLAYFGISTVLTMMIPYFEQDENAPLPHVFRIYGWTVAEYIVSIGAMFGLCASLMGAMFPLPRVVFAMSADGLLYQFMGRISDRFKTPFNGTLITGFLTGTLAAIFNLSQLVNMMSIGTLLAYSMVASCVLILRYESDDKNNKVTINGKGIQLNSSSGNYAAAKVLLRKMFIKNQTATSNHLSAKITTIAVASYGVWCLLFGLVVSKFEENFDQIYWLDYFLLCLSLVPIFTTLYIISRQPVSSAQLAFKVPLVPWLPGISILINVYLMLKLDSQTWVRFAVWILIGLVIYFTYGLRNSVQRRRSQQKFETTIITEKNTRSLSVPSIYVNSNSTTATNF